MTYWHKCIDCGEVLNELDNNAQGKPVLIFDDGGWFCRDCWKVYAAKQDELADAESNYRDQMSEDNWRTLGLEPRGAA